MKAALARWAPVAGYMALIFYESAQPALPPVVEPIWDKALHAAGYAGLALLWAWGLSDRFRVPLTLAVAATAWLLTVAYGAADEWHQSFVPPRQMDAADLLADAVGAAAMLAGLGLASRVRASGYNRSRNGL